MSSVRRNFGVTVLEEGDPAVDACLRDLDEIAERLRALAADGRCTFHDATSPEIRPTDVISYRMVFLFFKPGGSAASQYAANTMQELFNLYGPDGEHLVRFYCTDYYETPGMCTCPRLMLSLRPGSPLRYRVLNEVSVAHGWLMDRADLLRLPDERLAAIQAHPSTRQRVIDFITWLRANPTGH